MTDRRKFLKASGLAALGASTNAAAEVNASEQPQAPPTLTAELERRATEKMRQRLNIPVGSPLPPDVVSTIKREAAATSRRAVALGATRDVEEAAGMLGRGVTQQGFVEKMAAARAGVEQISKSQDVDAILKERATLLWKKRKALEDAGFPAAEAMQILLADIAARAH